MRRPRLFIWMIAALTGLTSDPLLGQYEHLEPSSWYPMHVGDVWHYMDDPALFGAFGRDFVIAIDKDTLIEDNQWFRFRQVRCQGPPSLSCDPNSTIGWRHLTPDLYVLQQDSVFSQQHPDTLSNTLPTSMFRMTTEQDTALNVAGRARAFEGPWVVSLREDPVLGTEVDSTNLVLCLYTITIGFADCYRYQVGFSSSSGELFVGALVNSVAIGDTTGLLEARPVGVESWEERRLYTELQLYPNPSTSHVYVGLTHDGFERLTLTVFDVQGRPVLSRVVQPSAAPRTTVRLDWPPRLARQPFLLVVEGNGAVFRSRLLIKR